MKHITFSLIGYGNVGQFFAQELGRYADLVQIYNRSAVSAEILPSPVDVVQDLADLKKADIYLIAVSDDAIASVARELYNNSRTHHSLVIHTSGAKTLDTLLPYRRRGYAWPLQTISRGKNIDVKNLPLYIGASIGEDVTLMDDLFSALSDQVKIIGDVPKSKMHLAACIASNFSNLMYTIASDFCQTNNLEFADLHHLIQETSEKIKSMDPHLAQTGPAIRGDRTTLSKQVQMIKEWKPDLESWFVENCELINPDLDL